MNKVEQRITRLEMQNRMMMALLIVFAAVGLLAFTGDDDVVTAHSFELVSADGDQRASLTLENDNPVFALNDENGVARVKLFQQPDMNGMYVLDEESTPRIGIAQFSHGGGGLALHGPQSQGAAVLYLKGEGSLRFFDADGNVTTRVPSLGGEEAKEATQ